MMKSLQTAYLRAGCVATGVICILFSVVAHAQFEVIEEKAQGIWDGLNAATIIIVALAFLIGGLGLLFQRLSGEWAFRIVLAGIIIGGSLEFATWLVGEGTTTV